MNPPREWMSGAKAEIISLIRDYADQGKGVLFVSSELAELMAVCDRIITIFDGHITGEIDRKDIETEEVLAVCNPAKVKEIYSGDKYMVYIIFAVVFVLFALILGNKGFLQPRNLINILRQTAMISVMSVAGVFVMAAGQIDLTVGSITAMTAMLVSLVLQATNNIFLALIVGLGFGALVGLVNGLLVTKLKLPAFLATLGTMELVRGAAMWITDTAAVPIENKLFCNIFGIGDVAGIPVLVIWTVLFYIAGILIFNKAALEDMCLPQEEMRTPPSTAVLTPRR